MIPIHDDNPTRRRPIVTLVLIAINVFVFAVVQPHDGGQNETRFLYERAAVPCEVQVGRPLTFSEINNDRCGEELGPKPFPKKDVWLSVLVAMFLHGSWLHLLGNLLFLWIFGNNVEDWATPVGYALLYVATGVLAALAHVLVDPDSVAPVIGASGAIAGVMGAYLVLWPRARVTTLVPIFLLIPMRLPAAFVLLSWFGLQFLTDPNSGVAWVAHVGGFAAGALLALLVRPVHPPRPIPVG